VESARKTLTGKLFPRKTEENIPDGDELSKKKKVVLRGEAMFERG